jgi:hypothetical protein
MKRLRVELLRKHLDLFFIDQVRVAGESLPDVQVVEVESLCRTSLIRVCRAEPRLFVQPHSFGTFFPVSSRLTATTKCGAEPFRYERLHLCQAGLAIMHDCLHDIERDIDGEDLFDGMIGEAGLKRISITGRLPECKFQRPEAVSFPFIMSFISFCSLRSWGCFRRQ